MLLTSKSNDWRGWNWKEISKSPDIDHLKEKFNIKRKNVGGRIPIILLKKR